MGQKDKAEAETNIVLTKPPKVGATLAVTLAVSVRTTIAKITILFILKTFLLYLCGCEYN
jgi:hypothetical protein